MGFQRAGRTSSKPVTWRSQSNRAASGGAQALGVLMHKDCPKPLSKPVLCRDSAIRCAWRFSVHVVPVWAETRT